MNCLPHQTKPALSMKLLVINQFASTPRYSTGAGERFYYLSKEFKKQGIQTTVLSAAYNHLFLNYPKDDQLFNKEETPGATFYWVKLKKYNPNSNLGRTLAFFEFLLKLFLFPIKKEGLPDRVIVSSMSIFPIYYAKYLKWRYKIPYVLEIRDIWPLTPIELGGHSPSHPFIKLLDSTARKGYKSASHIVSVLPGFKKFLEDYKCKYSGFSWIPNGISSELIREATTNKTEGPFTVAYTGAIGIANAMEHLIAAAKLLDENGANVLIKIFGDGPEKEPLENAAKGLSNVQFVGKIPKEEIQDELSKADCCYIGWKARNIYQYGVSANKYNDYMLASKTILSSSNIIDDPVKISGGGIQVEAENPQEIADAITRLSSLSTKELDDFGKKGNNYLRNNHLYSILGEKYIAVLKSITS